MWRGVEDSCQQAIATGQTKRVVDKNGPRILGKCHVTTHNVAFCLWPLAKPQLCFLIGNPELKLLINFFLTHKTET